MGQEEPTNTVSEVPDETRRLWGLRATRRRGPKPTLSVPLIVDAALGLADREGLDALSMSRVADAVDCTTMALYRHIDGKDELLTLLADRVSADAADLPPNLSWRDGLREWTRVQINEVLAHPWLLQLPLASMPLGPHRTRWIDQGFGVMRDLDLSAAEKGQVLNLLSLFVLSEARLQIELRDLATNPFAELTQIIDHLADREDLPHLFAALADPSTGTDDDAFGIELILDGIEARLDRPEK